MKQQSTYYLYIRFVKLINEVKLGKLLVYSIGKRISKN